MTETNPEKAPFDPSSVTDAQMLDALRQVAMEKPEYVYTAPEHMKGDFEGASCFYVHFGDDEDDSSLIPGCMVGAALHRLGIPLNLLGQHETRPARWVVRDFFPDVAPETAQIFTRAQGWQDSGEPWGAAYRKAVQPDGATL